MNMIPLVFQISKTPLPNDLWLDADAFCTDDTFIRDYAWRVEDIMPSMREPYIEDFTRLIGRPIENKGFVVDEIKKDEYQKTRYDAFEKELRKLSGCTVSYDEFATGYTNIAWRLEHLKDAYENRRGYFVDKGDKRIVPFDYFARIAQNGEQYFFGGIISYDPRF